GTVEVLLPARTSFSFSGAATPANYTLSLHDALPISCGIRARRASRGVHGRPADPDRLGLSARTADARHLRGDHRPLADRASAVRDRKSTRLNSSHVAISYAVFCLKKKNPKAHRPADY